MAKGRPKRDKYAELVRANAALDTWNSTPLTALRVSRPAERYWLRLRLGESEDTIDVLDGLVESSPPPDGDAIT